MKFLTVSVLKHPIDSVWTTMRDDLPLVTSKREDIHSVAEHERAVGPAGHKIVNIWTARMKLPPVVVGFLGADSFVWTDRAEWNNKTKICAWSIEPHHFRDAIHCQGTTAFTPALGGTGAKITFSGDLEWNSDRLPGLSGRLGDAVLGSLEGIIRNMIQKNFRKVAEAVDAHLYSIEKR